MNSNMESRKLPFDLITEILSWLPVESLLRFKCVCKKWYFLIQEPDFIAIHMHQATPVFLPPYLDSINERFALLESFAGLLLELDVITGKFHIRNPAIRQVLDLPDPQPESHWMSSAIDLQTGECKLLAGHSVINECSMDNGWEILSVGRDDNWRALPWQRNGEENGVEVKVIVVKTDNLIPHCVRIFENTESGDFDLYVASLDIWRESLEENTLPRGFFSDLSKAFSFSWDNYVAVASIENEELHIMLLEKDKNKYTWSNEKIIVSLRFLEENGYRKEKLVPVTATFEDLWFHFEEEIGLCCDVKTGRIKERVLLEDEKRKGFEYRPSLVALKRMRPEDGQG